MAKAKPKLTREETVERVLDLHDRAITLIRQSGRWERCGATPVMSVKNHGKISITYLTPFQRAFRTEDSEPLGYAIEVSVGRRIVLSLVWNIDGPLFCETYQPGTWEAQLDAPAVTACLVA
jgi:hypothetical protein